MFLFSPSHRGANQLTSNEDQEHLELCSGYADLWNLKCRACQPAGRGSSPSHHGANQSTSNEDQEHLELCSGYADLWKDLGPYSQRSRVQYFMRLKVRRIRLQQKQKKQQQKQQKQKQKQHGHSRVVRPTPANGSRSGQQRGGVEYLNV